MADHASDGRHYKMGEELTAAASPMLEVEITAPDTLSRVELHILSSSGT